MEELPLTEEQDVRLFVVVGGQTNSDKVSVGPPSEIGLCVPVLSAAVDVSVQVSPDGERWFNLYNGTGTQQLKIAATTGPFAFGSNDMGAVLGYPWMRLVVSASQAGNITCAITRKAVKVTPRASAP